MSTAFNLTPGNRLDTYEAHAKVNHRLVSMIATMIASWRVSRAYRRDVARLRSMDDRMLKDIGVSRTEIRHAVQVGRWND